MPVAVLPAALDTLLSSLLGAEEPTSWKVEGGPGSCVVVLRFGQRDGQPLLTSDTRGYWRKKSRDQLQQMNIGRRVSEGIPILFRKKNLIEVDVAKSVPAHDDARESCSHSPSDYITEPPVIFDPSHSDKLLQLATASAFNHDSSAREMATLQDQCATNNEATLEDLQGMMSEISQRMTCALEEQMIAMRSEITETCTFASVTDCDPLSPLPSTCAQRPCGAEKPTQKIRQAPPPRVHMNTPPALPSRTADRHGDMDAASERKPDRNKTPSTRQQPPRAAQKP